MDLPSRPPDTSSTSPPRSRCSARAFTTRPDEHVLVLLVHHIACDGWSVGAARHRPGHRLHGPHRPHRPGLGAELPIQYADYTLWQRDLLGSENDPSSTVARQSAFWRDALAGAPRRTDLPLDRPRPPTATQHGAQTPVTIGAHIHTRITELARQTGVTPFMIVQAALAVLLSQLGGATDIPLGTPVAGRTDEALNDLIGFFLNTLVLRTDVSGNPIFTQAAGPRSGTQTSPRSKTRTCPSNTSSRSSPHHEPQHATPSSRSCCPSTPTPKPPSTCPGCGHQRIEIPVTRNSQIRPELPAARVGTAGRDDRPGSGDHRVRHRPVRPPHGPGAGRAAQPPARRTDLRPRPAHRQDRSPGYGSTERESGPVGDPAGARPRKAAGGGSSRSSAGTAARWSRRLSAGGKSRHAPTPPGMSSITRAANSTR